MIDGGGVAAMLGEKLLENAEMLFDRWDKVRDGTRSRGWLNRQIDGRLCGEVKSLL
jgi:hypothetical protein